MPVHFPDEAASLAEKRVLLSQDLCFGRGWLRYMPPASILFMDALVNHGPLNKVDLGDWVRALFDPDGEDRPERKRTSLTRLARELDSDFESVRAGVLNLLDEGDFTTTINVENAAPHQVFELVVDWERFAATRIGLRFAIGGNDEPDKGRCILV